MSAGVDQDQRSLTTLRDAANRTVRRFGPSDDPQRQIRTRPSMCHEHRNRHLTQHSTRYATEYEFAQSRMSIAAHDHERGAEQLRFPDDRSGMSWFSRMQSSGIRSCTRRCLTSSFPPDRCLGLFLYGQRRLSKSSPKPGTALRHRVPSAEPPTARLCGRCEPGRSLPVPQW
jgi:hypothetical protein